MKNINKILSLAFVAVLASATFTSCEDEDKARFPELGNGGFVKFVSAPEFDAGLDPTSANFNSSVEDTNETAALYEITVAATWPQMVDGELELVTSDTIAYRSTTTFPFDIGFTGSDMSSLFNVPVETFSAFDSNFDATDPDDVEEFNRFSSFEFFGIVTTVDGVVYDGSASAFIEPTPTDPTDDGFLDPSDPDFIPEPGQWNFQNSDVGPLTSAPGLLAAFNWEVEFVDPEVE